MAKYDLFPQASPASWMGNKIVTAEYCFKAGLLSLIRVCGTLHQDEDLGFRILNFCMRARRVLRLSPRISAALFLPLTFH